MDRLPQPSDHQLPSHSMPILVQLGLTYRCNLKCDHCYALYRRDLNEFTGEEVKKLIDELWDMGSSSVVYSHGENLLRKDFHEIAGFIHRKGLYQTLMTNGFFLQTEEEIERLRLTGIDRVLVSVDSARVGVHDQKRGVAGAYEIALRSAELLKKGGVPTVGFSTTIDTHNYEEIEEIVELGKRYGVDAISFMQNRYNRPGVFNRELWVRYVGVCKGLYELMLANRGVIDLYTHDPFMLTLLDDRLDDASARDDFIGANICNVGTSMISIDPVGNVTACNFIEDSIGNVREESVGSIWQRLVERYSDVREPPSGPCGGCGEKSSCMGGCKAFHYTGKYDERCGEQRFGEEEVHGLEVEELPIYPTAPLTRKPGAYAATLRVIS